MGPLYLVVALGMLVSLVIMVFPQILWHFSAWQYKNPEKNEPSDLWYTSQRIGAGFTFVVLMVGCTALTAENSSSGSSGAVETSTGTDPDASASPEDSTPYDGPDDREEVTTSSEYGRIAGHSGSGHTLTVHLAPHDCQSTINNVFVDEEDDRLVVRAALYGDEALCGSALDGPISERVDLDEPVGEREVVDSDGEPIPERAG